MILLACGEWQCFGYLQFRNRCLWSLESGMLLQLWTLLSFSHKFKVIGRVELRRWKGRGLQLLEYTLEILDQSLSYNNSEKVLGTLLPKSHLHADVWSKINCHLSTTHVIHMSSQRHNCYVNHLVSSFIISLQKITFQTLVLCLRIFCSSQFIISSEFSNFFVSLNFKYFIKYFCFYKSSIFKWFLKSRL